MILRAAITACFTFILTISHCSCASPELIPDFTLMVPMRDGVELPVDLYFPDEPTTLGTLPCILLRSPVGRKTYPWRNYARLAQEGYLVAIQDTRSALDKEGKIIPYLADGWGIKKDGYDTVEWLASSGFTNGKIGTIGFSALGITQQMMAPSAPPSLKCQYIGVAAGSIYHYAVYPGGQLLKNQVEGWLKNHASDPSIFDTLNKQPHYNQFWKSFNSLEMAHEVNVPAIHYGGWYDTFIQGTLESFMTRQKYGKEGARGKQKIVIGPWTHFWPEMIKLGDFTVPSHAREMPKLYLPNRWFDCYLKDFPHQAQEIPPVTYFVMGPFDGSLSSGNVWRTAQEWPVASQPVSFYLDRNYRLTKNKPTVEREFYAYHYNPADPVPTLGGRNLFLESGPKNQQPIEVRDDVIVFTSEPLEDEIEITGHLFANIFFESSCEDTDVVLRFCDLYPDGKSILIADGICSTKQPNSDAALGGPVALTIDLWSTSIVIARGHCLRLSISNSNYPKYEKKTKGEIQANKIMIGSQFPSRLILPVVLAPVQNP